MILELIATPAKPEIGMGTGLSWSIIDAINVRLMNKLMEDHLTTCIKCTGPWRNEPPRDALKLRIETRQDDPYTTIHEKVLPILELVLGDFWGATILSDFQIRSTDWVQVRGSIHLPIEPSHPLLRQLSLP